MVEFVSVLSKIDTVVPIKIASDMTQRCLMVFNGAKYNSNKPIKKAYINTMNRNLKGKICRKRLLIRRTDKKMMRATVPIFNR